MTCLLNYCSCSSIFFKGKICLCSLWKKWGQIPSYPPTPPPNSHTQTKAQPGWGRHALAMRPPIGSRGHERGKEPVWGGVQHLWRWGWERRKCQGSRRDRQRRSEKGEGEREKSGKDPTGTGRAGDQRRGGGRGSQHPREGEKEAGQPQAPWELRPARIPGGWSTPGQPRTPAD